MDYQHSSGSRMRNCGTEYQELVFGICRDAKESPAGVIVKVGLNQSCFCFLLTEWVCMGEQTLYSIHSRVFQLQSFRFCYRSQSDRSPETCSVGMPFSCSLCFL